MVTELDTGSDEQDLVEDLTPLEEPLEDVGDDDATITTEGVDNPDTLLDTPTESVETPPVDTATATTPPPPQPVDQRSLDELRELRAAKADKEWRDRVGGQARSYEQQLQNQGYLPEQAREQARRFVAAQQQQKQQEQKTAEMVGFVEGRQAAAVHFMKENGLASRQMLDDLSALQRANSPEDMKREAERMKRERALIAENARLKQGLVQPQSFDNSQGAAEAAPNDARLLDAYINGDRSEAARKAVERSMNGG